jgi:nucleolar protein 14
LILHLATEDPIPFNTITEMIVRLHVLTTQFPSSLTQDIFSAIESGRKRMTSSLNSNRVFPTAQELVLFYTISQIYPTSDFSHGIVNPTTLFMSQILAQMKVQTIQDLARGLFICSLFLQVFSKERKY